MVRQYRSFVIRHWRLNGDRRIKIEHLQSGESAQVVTLAEALAWLDARCGGALAAPDQTTRSRDGGTPEGSTR